MLVEGKHSTRRWYRGFPSKLKELLWLRQDGLNSHPVQMSANSQPPWDLQVTEFA